MKELTDFVERQRARLKQHDGNIFSISWGKVVRHSAFLQIIGQRYKEASATFVARNNAFMAEMKSDEVNTLTSEQLRYFQESGYFLTVAHLEIESYYLFAKILLDEISHAIEGYFGPGRDLSFNSHDNLFRSLKRYGTVKGLTITTAFEEAVSELRQRISDFRDQQIAHEKSPRTLKGTMWGPDGEIMIVAHRAYTRDTDRQINSETLGSLSVALERYVRLVIDFIESNESKSRFNNSTD